MRLLKPGKKIKFKTRFKTTQLFKFTCTKDPTPLLNKSNVVYEVKCPACSANYVGKTDRTLFERTKEHAWDSKDSPVRQHLSNCQHFHHLYGILSLGNGLFNDDVPTNESSFREFSINSVRNNVKILDYDRNWNNLLYKEALYIERLNPNLNSGLQASRKLNLFK